MEYDYLVLTDDSKKLMSALENVKNVIEHNNTESLQLEWDMLNNLLDTVDKAYFTYESMIIYKRALDYLINDVDWSEEDIDLLKIYNGNRHYYKDESLSDDLIADVDDFSDKVWDMFEEYCQSIDGDFNRDTLDVYINTADMMHYLEDGLRERYGFE